jgi:23S rRNA pseudouridine1911/1915/1917 synthase
MPNTDVIERVIPYEWYGLRIDRALAQLFSEFSRAQLTQWLKIGRIIVSGGPYKPKDKVLGGERVTLSQAHELMQPDTHALQPEAIPLDIIYEDEACLVVNKPAGMVVHPGAGNHAHTLVNALLHHAPSLLNMPRAGLIHRLDKDTTGLLVVAKTEAAHAALVRKLQAREIDRHYLALVHGHVIAGGTIETGYGRDPRNRIKMAVTGQERQAITLYTVQKHYQGSTLLNVKLMTGRTHQIRVHMAYIKHPIVGDLLYGSKTRNIPGLSEAQQHVVQQFKRQALHAYQLGFEHPIHHEKLIFTAPIPDDFQTILTTLQLR